MAHFHHPLFRSIGRGLAQRCPCCGKGGLYRRYLKVRPNCEACGHDLARYPADDGPAYLTILLVGHLIIGPMLFFPVVWEASPAYSLPIILGSLTAITLLALPRIKGGWIGMMYAFQSTDRDQRFHTADVAD